MTNDQVVACIDGSAFLASVCDHAAWVASRLAAPVTLLHAIDHRHASKPHDFSGSIGLGSQESLLQALSVHDHEMGKLALERGRHLLEAAQARVATGGQASSARLVHGSLVDRLVEVEASIRIAILGRRGEGAYGAKAHLGSNLERIIRAMHRPILVVPPEFREPASVMLAFDNGPSTRKGVEVLMRGPLFRGMACHIVMAGAPSSAAHDAYAWARAQLESAGFTPKGGVFAGDAESVLLSYQREHAIDLVIMGAYGHSRIRHLLVGSTTTAMLRRIETPLLLLR